MDMLIYSLFCLFLFSCNVNCLFLFKCTQVGRIKCPLLLVTAGDDQAFPAVESAEDVSYIFYVLYCLLLR